MEHRPRPREARFPARLSEARSAVAWAREKAEEAGLAVEDDGPEFDPLSVPLPDDAASLEEREPGGLGLLIVRRVATELRWRRIGERNVVTVVFAGRDGDAGRAGRQNSRWLRPSPVPLAGRREERCSSR